MMAVQIIISSAIAETTAHFNYHHSCNNRIYKVLIYVCLANLTVM